LSAMVFADARPLQFDVTGRIVIPEDLLKHANIKESALFVGRGNSFQIWNPSDFATIQDTSLNNLKKIRPTLKIVK
nr:division/cell wall cluster transcriptional repressor MraZ [Candidatus Enterousia merdequi]